MVARPKKTTMIETRVVVKGDEIGDVGISVGAPLVEVPDMAEFKPGTTVLSLRMGLRSEGGSCGRGARTKTRKAIE